MDQIAVLSPPKQILLILSSIQKECEPISIQIFPSCIQVSPQIQTKSKLCSPNWMILFSKFPISFKNSLLIETGYLNFLIVVFPSSILTSFKIYKPFMKGFVLPFFPQKNSKNFLRYVNGLYPYKFNYLSIIIFWIIKF